MSKRRNYRIVGETELPPEEAARFDALEAQADQEVEELRVNFRWGVEQVDMVKRAAALMGVPYQTYIKEAVYRRAVADVRAAKIVKLRGLSPKSKVQGPKSGVQGPRAKGQGPKFGGEGE